MNESVVYNKRVDSRDLLDEQQHNLLDFILELLG